MSKLEGASLSYKRPNCKLGLFPFGHARLSNGTTWRYLVKEDGQYLMKWLWREDMQVMQLHGVLKKQSLAKIAN